MQLDGDIDGEVPEDEVAFLIELAEWLETRGCWFSGWVWALDADDGQVRGTGKWTPAALREALKVEAG